MTLNSLELRTELLQAFD